jgi:ATP-dependent RNA helicase DHX36
LESIKRKLDPHVYRTLQDHRIEDLNIDLINELLKHLCRGPPGAILVFLPGIGDITKLMKLMNSEQAHFGSKCEIYPLHSKLPSLDQHKIFERPPSHIRKIIIATNIAETSITIDDIVYVVDCGKIKYSGLNVEHYFSTLKTEWVSQANLRQRYF